MRRNQSTDTDHSGYSGVDSGCDVATEHLKRRSSCLECPFDKCVYDDDTRVDQHSHHLRPEEKRDIIAQHKAGRTLLELAEQYGVRIVTVRKILEAKL